MLNNPRIERFSLFITLSLIFCFAIFLQSQILMNVDVSWLAEASKRMLAGGNYTNDFFENNPPWILYFNIPPMLAVQYLSVNSVMAMKIYIFLLAAISLACTYPCLQKLFVHQSVTLKRLLMTLLALLFVILPINDFGQREHLLFMQSLPYLLMMALRVEGKKIDKRFAFFVGLLAGSVFLMKPYFLAAPFFVEIYFAWKKQSFLAWMRPEIFAMLSLFLIYMSLIFIRHPDYLHLVLPYAMRWCYLGTRKPMLFVIINHYTVYCVLACLFSLATLEINQLKSLTVILILALVGFFISYAVQQEDWPYHILPAYYLAIFIFCVGISNYFFASEKKKYVSVLLAFFSVLLVLYLKPYYSYFDSQLVRYPQTFFYYGLCIFAMIFCFSNRVNKSLSPVYVSAFSILAGLLTFLTLSPFMLWSSLTFFTTSCVMLVSFSLLASRMQNRKYEYLLMTTLCSLIFLIPYTESFILFAFYKQTKANYKNEITFIDQHAQLGPIYFFTTNIAHAYPVIPYSQNQHSASRFSFFWALPGLLKQTSLPMDSQKQALLHEDKNFLINMVVADLNTHKPALLFVDNMARKNSLIFYDFTKDSLSARYMNFDYIKYFSENKNFENAWKSYRFLTNLSANYIRAINPAAGKLKLTYRNKPAASGVSADKFYLYLTDQGNLEVTLKDIYAAVRRLTLPSIDFPAEELTAIKNVLANPGAALTRKEKNLILLWLAQHDLIYEDYNFNVYERIN